MQLLIVRHGVAADQEEFAKTGQADDERPLTAKGRKKMKRAARGLCAIVPEIALLATSPLVRAKQTADIVAEAYDREVDAVTGALRPDSAFSKFVDWVKPHRDQSLVCIVGHEPHLSGLATWLMSGSETSRLELGKGGACLLSFDGVPKKGGATLVWLLTSKQLEAIGESS
jgi:phosphohistidine phosphatase